jgi:hypothetical protein
VAPGLRGANLGPQDVADRESQLLKAGEIVRRSRTHFVVDWRISTRFCLGLSFLRAFANALRSRQLLPAA